MKQIEAEANGANPRMDMKIHRHTAASIDSSSISAAAVAFAPARTPPCATYGKVSGASGGPTAASTKGAAKKPTEMSQMSAFPSNHAHGLCISTRSRANVPATLANAESKEGCPDKDGNRAVKSHVNQGSPGRIGSDHDPAGPAGSRGCRGEA
jgi:hypothetical protein